MTGRRRAGNICRHYPGRLLQSIVVLLFVTNAMNIGANLGAMEDATRSLIGVPVRISGKAYSGIILHALVSRRGRSLDCV